MNGDYVGVELANETREVVMFEVLRKQVSSEFSRTPNNKSGSVFVPRNKVVQGRIVDELVSFCKEWSR